ncbi:CYTH domain-containing protein [Streptomyces sp. A0958]|uniref:class IV adenylate cyclase n=1 Tax=Streptomyces sp. A0958 TaxID=2563101 RepID=UPI00109E4C61|nr:CYTH domain-containing protein [Streptomyces sp. A0958]THA72717.1 CYTH domain-containing protein [Streptomyces sp. A0958]
MTNIEYEVKALDVDLQDIARRIFAAGGAETTPRRLMRRYVYDTVPPVAGRWVRLRDTGDTTTLCVKEITTDAVDGTRETEVTVGDFTEAAVLLRLIGLVPRSYQENHRTSYTLGTVRLEIDEWPRIPPYLEIEADDEEQVWEAAAAIGLDRDQLTSLNTTKVYGLYGIDLESITELRFE